MAEGPPTIESKPLTLVYDMPIGKIRKFWEGIKKGKIYTSRCMKCGKLYFPPVGDCGLCLSSDMEWVELSGEAEVETFSHIPVRPASFQQHEPYTITIGRLKDGSECSLG